MLNVNELEEAPVNISVETILKRNERLKKFFHQIFPEDEVMIIGDPNKPSIIRIPKDAPAYCISCFVHNFTLIFTDSPFRGNHIYSITLTERAVRHTPREQVIDAIKNSSHRTVYQIQEKNSGLLLCGYNFIDKTNEETKYPVFSRFRPKIYFNMENVQELVDRFPSYELEIVS
jgi:hypothetical protein